MHQQQTNKQTNKQKDKYSSLYIKDELRRLWRKHYMHPGSPMNSVALKIGAQSNRSLYQLLVKKKLPRLMLFSNPSETIPANQ